MKKAILILLLVSVAFCARPGGHWSVLILDDSLTATIVTVDSVMNYSPPFGRIDRSTEDGDTLTCATADTFYVIPVADSAYAEWDSLSDFYEYSTGEAIGADQEFWIVLWESVSEDSTRSQLYINIQAGTNTYKKPKDCEQDKSHMIPKSIPAAFAGTGVLICGMILTSEGDSTCFFTDGTKFQNLRGESGDGGGSSGAPATDSTQITGWGFIPMWTSGDTLYFEVGDSTWSVVRDAIIITP